MKLDLKMDQLENLTDELVDTTTAEHFLGEVSRIAHAGAEHKYDVAAQVANSENLKSKGISLPDKFRISLRNFEIPLDTRKTNKKLDEPMVCFEAGCASVFYDNTITSVSLDSGEPQHEFSNERIKETLQQDFKILTDFVKTKEFRGLLEELYNIPEDSKRKQFVLDVILNSSEIANRNIETPENVYIRRSYFTDNRPTLFCVSKRTPLAQPWDKVTITFDSK